MSSDVGDSVRLVYTGETGADVTATVTDPDGLDVAPEPVAEDPDSPGSYPYTFVPGTPGRWRVVFTAAGTVSAVEPYWVDAVAVDRPAPLATVEDVATLWRPLADAERDQAALLLRMASAALRNRCPFVDTRMAAGTLDPDLPRMVAVRMVLRVLRNPDMIASKITGPYAVTYASGGLNQGAGQVEVTDADVALLTGGQPDRRGRVATVNLGVWTAGTRARGGREWT